MFIYLLIVICFLDLGKAYDAFHFLTLQLQQIKQIYCAIKVMQAGREGRSRLGAGGTRTGWEQAKIWYAGRLGGLQAVGRHAAARKEERERADRQTGW